MKITLTEHKKVKPDFTKLGFGKYFTDHMLVMYYHNGAWEEPEIVPYDAFAMDPCTNVLHYGQGIFEGLKAYKTPDGKITTFRPYENFNRMNRSAQRLCMPQLDVDLMVDCLKKLVEIEQDWIPTAPGTSLYIRPTMIANDKALGVHAAHDYIFFIILSPVGSYYANGLAPTKILVEDTYVRATPGGTGEAKCMGNYAASILAGEIANQKGYDQVLWLDGVERKYVEEVGSMNIVFVIDGVVVTPALVGSILPGITRKSTLEVLRKAGYKVEERRISIEEVIQAHKDGKLNEVFGTGTAAVISPVGVLNYKGVDYVINNNEMGEISRYAYDTITGIQYGRIKDEFGWIEKCN
ncbi:MAG: branched-chain amino acid aminotransferase [Clostridia bacterium]|nr:branched-chain amino acid aminotransferase [Clostridia bacterium]